MRYETPAPPAEVGRTDGLAYSLWLPDGDPWAGVVIDRFSYTPVFIAVGLLPVLSLTALMVLVGTIRPISLEEIMQRRKTSSLVRSGSPDAG